MQKRGVVVLAAVVSLGLCLGCNKKLHKNTEVLLDSLESGDFATLKSVAGPKLLEELDEETFLQFSATYQMLGKLKDRTRTGTGNTNGTQYINYKLEFEKGKLDLGVVSNSKGLIDGFNFSGDSWQEAVKALLLDRAGKLLDAMAAKDTAAVEKLFTAGMVKEIQAKPLPDMTGLGKRKALELDELSDTDVGGTFSASFEHGSIELEVGMRGGKISSLNLKDPDEP